MSWRAAALVTTGIVVVLWRACIPSADEYVLVEFGMDPELFAGAEILVDGVVVGVLERRGSRTVNGFRVEEGEHEVELRKEGFGSRPARVRTGFGAGRALLVADLDSGRPGEVETLVLRR